MRTIHMGVNTEPAYLIADTAIKAWTSKNNTSMVEEWIRMRDKSLSLKEEIVKVVEEDGEAELSWDCMGRTRHMMHALQWEEALPQYQFTVGYNYECIVRKKET